MNRILIKLFEINMVASNFFGFSNNSLTKSYFVASFFFKSVLDIEKKATSVPEIMADNNNKIIRVITP